MTDFVRLACALTFLSAACGKQDARNRNCVIAGEDCRDGEDTTDGQEDGKDIGGSTDGDGADTEPSPPSTPSEPPVPSPPPATGTSCTPIQDAQGRTVVACSDGLVLRVTTKKNNKHTCEVINK